MKTLVPEGPERRRRRGIPLSVPLGEQLFQARQVVAEGRKLPVQCSGPSTCPVQQRIGVRNDIVQGIPFKSGIRVFPYQFQVLPPAQCLGREGVNPVGQLGCLVWSPRCSSLRLLPLVTARTIRQAAAPKVASPAVAHAGRQQIGTKAG